jgi:UDP-hydrolysing UDP-N-acetyl-D-glucosamine 2-epimerase
LPDRGAIAILTTGRQDYWILRSVIMHLQQKSSVPCELWVGGMHLVHDFGHTVEAIRRDGLTVACEIAFNTARDPVSDAGDAVKAVGAAIASRRPSAILLCGDRSETLAAAVAATLSVLPIVHLHGGEETEGAIDNACRHAITKLSHLHLVSHPLHAQRVVQMGEPAETVHVVGAPGLDQYLREDLPSPESVRSSLRLGAGPVLIVTWHAVTADSAETDRGWHELAASLSTFDDIPVVITKSNIDSGGEDINARWASWAVTHSNAVVVDFLGDAYWSLLRDGAVVVGNSSSGVIEAPAVGVPSVNIGSRQQGRLRHGPVTDVSADKATITAAITRAVMQARARSGTPRHHEPVAPRIGDILERWNPPAPPQKRFCSIGYS